MASSSEGSISFFRETVRVVLLVGGVVAVTLDYNMRFVKGTGRPPCLYTVFTRLLLLLLLTVSVSVYQL